MSEQDFLFGNKSHTWIYCNHSHMHCLEYCFNGSHNILETKTHRCWIALGQKTFSSYIHSEEFCGGINKNMLKNGSWRCDSRENNRSVSLVVHVSSTAQKHGQVLCAILYYLIFLGFLLGLRVFSAWFSGTLLSCRNSRTLTANRINRNIRSNHRISPGKWQAWTEFDWNSCTYKPVSKV